MFCGIFGSHVDPSLAFGSVLVDERNYPLASGGVVWADMDGTPHLFVFGYFGPNGRWIKRLPGMIFREFRKIKTILLEDGIERVYAEAAIAVPNADKFIEGLGGKPTGKPGDFGPIYEIHLRELRI